MSSQVLAANEVLGARVLAADEVVVLVVVVMD